MKTRTKYNVGKSTACRTHKGITFDSAVEMKYYRDVILPQLANGQIVSYEMQKKFVLLPAFEHKGKKVRAIEYWADFYVVNKNGLATVIDIKGCPDPVAKIKRKMFWNAYPELDYVWIGYSKKDGGWKTYEEITLNRKRRAKIYTVVKKKRSKKENENKNNENKGEDE